MSPRTRYFRILIANTALDAFYILRISDTLGLIETVKISLHMYVFSCINICLVPMNLDMMLIVGVFKLLFMDPAHVNSDFIRDFRKLPFPSHLGKYIIKIGKISTKIHEIGKI